MVKSVLIQKCRGVAQPGSALEWGSSGRWFKSSRPDQFSKGFGGFNVKPCFLFFLSVPTLCPLITVKAIAPRLCFPGQVLQYARYVKPFVNKG